MKEAEATGVSIRDLALKKRLLTKKEIDSALSPSRLTSPDLPLKK